MNLIQKCFPIVAIAATSFFAVPAQAFSVGGTPTYSSNGLPTQLSVANEVQIPDGDIKFNVPDAGALEVGSLFLEGVLSAINVTGSASYAAVPNYITGFQFLGQDAVFNINAGDGVIAGFANNSNFTIDSLISQQFSV